MICCKNVVDISFLYIIYNNVDSQYIYILIGKLRENPIRFQIGIRLESNFVLHVSSNLKF